MLPLFVCLVFFFFIRNRPPQISSLFPTPTLFRSRVRDARARHVAREAVSTDPSTKRNGNRSNRCPKSVYRSCRRKRSEEHTSELQSPCNLVCRLLLEKKKQADTYASVLLS